MLFTKLCIIYKNYNLLIIILNLLIWFASFPTSSLSFKSKLTGITQMILFRLFPNWGVFLQSLGAPVLMSTICIVDPQKLSEYRV